MWQWYESTPAADIAVNRHQSSISSLESYSTSKYPQLEWGWKRLEWGWNALKWFTPVPGLAPSSVTTEV